MSTLTIGHGAIRRGGRVVLHAAELVVPVGATVGVVGLNGAGKSTLMLGLAGLLHPRCGDFRIEGTPSRVAIAPQHAKMPPWLTGSEIAALYGIDWTELSSLEGLVLDELRDTHAARFSTGQAQVLATAIVVQSAAPVMLLDEPFAALDFRRRMGLLALLEGRVAGPSTLMMSSPAVADLVGSCTWIVVINNGHYQFAGPLAEFVDHATEPALSQQRIEAKLMGMLDQC